MTIFYSLKVIRLCKSYILAWISFRLVKRKVNFYNALKTCKTLKNNHFKHEDDYYFNQDISNLLTLGKLNHFRSKAHHEHLLGYRSIWINAFKANNIWYEYHQTRHLLHIEHNAEKLLGTHNVQEITRYDLDRFGQGDLYEMGKDYDGLIYNPYTKKLAIKNLLRDYRVAKTIFPRSKLPSLRNDAEIVVKHILNSQLWVKGAQFLSNSLLEKWSWLPCSVLYVPTCLKTELDPNVKAK